MTTSRNLKVPETLLRLGESVVEQLVQHGLTGDITHETILDVLSTEYRDERRTARALLKVVTEGDVDEFNKRLSAVRVDVKPTDKLKLRTSYARGICQILKYHQ